MDHIKIKISPKELYQFISKLITVNKTVWLEIRKSCIQARLYDENQQNVKSCSLQINNTDFENTFKVGFADGSKINKILSNFLIEKEIDLKLTYGLSGYASEILFSSGNLKIKYPLADPRAFTETFVDDDRFTQLLSTLKPDFIFDLSSEQLSIINKNIDLSSKGFLKFKTCEDGIFAVDGDEFLNLKIHDLKYDKEFNCQFLKSCLDCLDSNENYIVEGSEYRTVFKSKNSDSIILMTNVIDFEDDWDNL